MVSLRSILSSRVWGLHRSIGRDRLVFAERHGKRIVVAPAVESVEAHPTGPGRRLRVVSAVSDMSVRHERIALPPMSPKLVRRALERRRVGEGPSASIELDYAAQRPDTPNDILAVSVERSVVDRTMDEVAAAGYEVARLTTPMVSIVGMLRAAGVLEVGIEGASVIVHIGEAVGSVGFVHEDALHLARAFRMPEDARIDTDAGAPALDPSDHERVIGEIGRSLLFFNHQLQGRPVGRILLSSDLAGADALCEPCAERFRVPVLNTIEELGLDLGPFLRCGGSAAGGPGIWLGAIAAAIAGLTRDPDIDLRPRSLVEARLARRARMVTSSAFLVGASVMAIAQVGTMQQLDTSARELRAANAELGVLQDELYLLGETLGRKRATDTTTLIIANAERPLALLDAALRALSAAADDGVYLEEVELDASAGVLRVSGVAGGERAVDAKRAFAGFFLRLRKAPAFEKAAFEPISIEPDETTELAMLRFEIRTPIES